MSDQTAPNQIAELKVSGHTMALEPGTYCVFSAPGSPPPDTATGLPVVRISAAPGQDSSHVEIAGLNAQGWIRPDSATLVRVAGARADVLVTVYQARNTAADAPALQVVRIAGTPDTVPTAAPRASAPERPDAARATSQAPVPMQVLAHIYSAGDVGGQVGEWMGEPGSKRWIEGFAIAPNGIDPASEIEYQAVLGRGWLSPWSAGGQFCGSRAMSLPILGLRVRLKGAAATTRRIRLEATFVDGSTVGPVGDGEPCEAESLSALEAFRLVIEDASTAAAARKSAVAKSASAKTPTTKTPAAKPPAEQPALTKPAPTKPAPTKPVLAKSAIAKPTQAKRAPAQPAPAPAKPAAAKRAAAKPVPAETPRAPAKAAPAPAAPAVLKAPKARAARTPAPTRRR